MSQSQPNYYASGGGGGYLQGGSPFSQGGSPGGTRRTDIQHSLRPCTILQLNQASRAHTDAEWKIDDNEIGQVTIVGHVASIQKQATHTFYTIDDGTGVIEARYYWPDGNEEDGPKFGAGIKEHEYVRLRGVLNSFGKRRYIKANNIRKIKDPHEVYFHILEAISVVLTLERGTPSNPNQVSAKGISSPDISAYSAQTSAFGRHDQFANLPPLQRKILEFISDHDLPGQSEGVKIDVIAQAIARGAGDANKISDALDKLMDDGLVFTTIDDSHFKVSE